MNNDDTKIKRNHEKFEDFVLCCIYDISLCLILFDNNSPDRLFSLL